MEDQRFEHLLYTNRPDLWAVTRVLRHCKGSDKPKAIWNMLTEDEQECLRDIGRGKLPELLSLQPTGEQP